MKIDRLPARLRLFHIWQVTGRNPFKHADEPHLEPTKCPSCGHEVSTPYCPYCGQPYIRKNKSFFHGSFDSIPFLNDDARRTLVHLLLRPGYMIRDYMNGMSARYMAPMTCLIIFYAFLSIMLGVLSPEVHTYTGDGQEAGTVDVDEVDSLQDDNVAEFGSLEVSLGLNDTVPGISHMLQFVHKGYVYLHLDQNPQMVDTRTTASIAALEGALRSQGVFSFVWQLVFLTLAMKVVFRKNPTKMDISASATFASYVLSQMCFFMMLALLVSLGKSHSLGVAIIAVVLIVDFVQFFQIGRKQAFIYAIKVGLWYYILMIVAILTVVGVLALFFLL